MSDLEIHLMVGSDVAIVLGVSAIVWPEVAVTVLVTFLGANLALRGVIGHLGRRGSTKPGRDWPRVGLTLSRVRPS